LAEAYNKYNILAKAYNISTLSLERRLFVKKLQDGALSSLLSPPNHTL
jgi:hypothetical protein